MDEPWEDDWVPLGLEPLTEPDLYGIGWLMFVAREPEVLEVGAEVLVEIRRTVTEVFYAV